MARLFLASAVLAMVMYVEGAQPNATCSAPGLMCKNCDELAVCIGDVAGNLKQWTISNCREAGGSCRNGECKQGVKCNYRNFTCSEAGSFPDPYDCTLKHLCNGLSEIPQTIQCRDLNTGLKTAYDSTYNQCGYPIEGNKDCETSPVPRCENNLQVGTATTNKNVYYICTEGKNDLGPSMFRCPPATEFIPATFECTAPS